MFSDFSTTHRIYLPYNFEWEVVLSKSYDEAKTRVTNSSGIIEFKTLVWGSEPSSQEISRKCSWNFLSCSRGTTCENETRSKI